MLTAKLSLLPLAPSLSLSLCISALRRRDNRCRTAQEALSFCSRKRAPPAMCNSRAAVFLELLLFSSVIALATAQGSTKWLTLSGKSASQIELIPPLADFSLYRLHLLQLTWRECSVNCEEDKSERTLCCSVSFSVLVADFGRSERSVGFAFLGLN